MRLALAIALVAGIAACGRHQYQGEASRLPPSLAAPIASAPAGLVLDDRLVASATTAADRIAAQSARQPDVGWVRLRELAHGIGHRISGSTALDRAIAWAERRMRDDGLDDVRTDPVMVPHWVRGTERGLRRSSPRSLPLARAIRAALAT